MSLDGLWSREGFFSCIESKLHVIFEAISTVLDTFSSWYEEGRIQLKATFFSTHVYAVTIIFSRSKGDVMERWSQSRRIR